MINRVKESSLTEELDENFDDIYLYEGKPYSGVAYEIDFEYTQNVLYEEGRYTGKYHNELFPQKEGMMHLEVERLEPTPDSYSGEPILHHDRRFTGIAYRFDGDICIEELYYEDGVLLAKEAFYRSGRRAIISSMTAPPYYSCHNYESGGIEQYQIHRPGVLRFSAECSEAQKLKSLHLEGDLFTYIKEEKDKIKLPLADDISYLKNLPAAERLFLSGGSVDDSLFDYLYNSNALEQVEELVLFDTGLSRDSLSMLKRLNNLKTVDIEGDKKLLSALEQLKKEAPQLKTVFNREQI